VAPLARLLGAGLAPVSPAQRLAFHGVERGVLYDLGDFLDDYATDPMLRNDLGLLFFVTLGRQATRIEALPLKLEYCHTCRAAGDDAAWIRRRFRDACARLGSEAHEEEGRLVVEWGSEPGSVRSG
jgi:hypothetical protein